MGNLIGIMSGISKGVGEMYDELRRVVNNYETMEPEELYRELEVINEIIKDTSLGGTEIPKDIASIRVDLRILYERANAGAGREDEVVEDVLSRALKFLAGLSSSLTSYNRWFSAGGYWS